MIKKKYLTITRFKKYLIILIINILLGCNNLKYLDAYDGYKGKPKEIEAINYQVEYKDNLPIETLSYKDVYYYDKHGRKIKTLSFKSDGSPSLGSSKYFYDKFGNQISNTFFDLEGKVSVQNNYKYNKYGQEIEREYIAFEKKSYSRHNINRKNRTVIIEDNKTGFFRKVSIVKYNKDWKLIKSTSFDTLGNQLGGLEYDYFRNGKASESRWYDAKNTLYSINNFKYNSKGDRIEIKKYRVNNGESKLFDLTTIEYIYDKRGNIIETKLIINNQVKWVTRNVINY
jgi:hypothetical protein